MRLIFGLVLLVGVALAGGAVYMAQTYVGSYQAALEAERNKDGEYVPLVDIYVANRQISYGEPIKPEDVKLIRFPRESLPTGAFSKKRPPFSEGEAPRIALRKMEINEPLMAVKLSEPGAPTGLAARLDRGQRAFTIEVDTSNGMSGSIRVDDRVEVYWTGQAPEDENGNGGRNDVTRLIESGLRVIALDQNADASDPSAVMDARTVTVAAKPEQVASLAQALQTGQLTLSLMGTNDEAVTHAIEVDQRDLLDMEKPVQQAQVAKPRVCTMRTRKGAEVVETPIPCTN